MTELERKVIEAVFGSDYNAGSGYYGENAIGNEIWAFSVVNGLARAGVNRASRGGAISSCIKKGWIEFQEKNGGGDEDYCHLTRAGYDAAMNEGVVIPGADTVKGGA